MTTRAIDLFAGWGGFTMGAERAGVRVVWAGNHWQLAVDVDALIKAGTLEWRTNASEKPGRKFYPLRHVKSGIPIDLFAVLPPAQWGAIFAIRTGPGDFSKHLVTICQRRGFRCVEERLERSDRSVVDTPEERDFLRACGVDWLEPEMRR